MTMEYLHINSYQEQPTQFHRGDLSAFVGISAQLPAVQRLLLLAPIPLPAELCSSVILKSAKLSRMNPFPRFFHEFLRELGRGLESS